MRCNTGVNPLYLLDQHLIAEYRELPMVVGSLEYWKWEIKSEIPEVFNLGAGHMNFFKVRLEYLRRRHEAVKVECRRRGFKCDFLHMDVSGYDNFFCSDWQPSMEDSMKIRNRITEKIRYRFEKSPKFWKYNRKTMDSATLEEIIKNIKEGDLYYV